MLIRLSVFKRQLGPVSCKVVSSSCKVVCDCVRLAVEVNDKTYIYLVEIDDAETTESELCLRIEAEVQAVGEGVRRLDCISKTNKNTLRLSVQVSALAFLGRVH